MHLYFAYNPSKVENIHNAISSLDKAMRTLFGDGFNIYHNPATITAPNGSDFVEIDKAIADELKKHPALKGLRYQLQMCRDMLVV